MEHLDSKWIDNKESKCVTDAHKSPARLSLWNMRDVFILVTGGVAAGAFFSTIEVIYGRRKARQGRERAVAIRYVEKWRARACDGLRVNKYNLSRPVIRRGFAGLEPCTLNNLVETDVRRECGVFAYACCVLFVLLFLWPCSPLPCFMESFSDFVHVCPVCSHKIGREDVMTCARSMIGMDLRKKDCEYDEANLGPSIEDD
ncbi:unnamed protein product [Heligmosomoides polygyrus]|uniref:LITAF domain-containing protein n=1 Tax=Heligmosomoides polygyrus TaxID=6339 RepID=A0A183F6I2_HELPZ|nr:unnamed protein product [Heligmosomoides polygyrus]